MKSERRTSVEEGRRRRKNQSHFSFLFLSKKEPPTPPKGETRRQGRLSSSSLTPRFALE
jgi:hypothetical protein